MKCPICKGTGIEKVYDKRTNAYLHIPCATCNETGHINYTNEEWLEQASTEEKAKFLKKISFCCNTCSPEQFKAYKNGKFECPLKMACATANGFEDWLKEKHHE